MIIIFLIPICIIHQVAN